MAKNKRLKSLTPTPLIPPSPAGTPVWLYLVLGAWPFLFLYPYVVTVDGLAQVIGNDFFDLYYYYKVYLLDSLSHFHLPLWSPSEAAGFPFYSSPFSPTFYPLNLPLVFFYQLFDGYSALDHQRFTVFGISIFCVGLYLWLRALRLPLRSAVFSALVASVSYKVTELVRFPNAVHTMAWYPWILLAITRIFQSSSWKQAFQWGILLSFVLICFLTGGYPYFIYYSLFLFLPYISIFLVPRLRDPLVGLPQVQWRRSLGLLSGACLASVLLCGPYLFKMAALLRQTTDRNQSNFSFSTQHGFGWIDTVGSLIFPPVASDEGWYYFGCLGIFLLALYLFGKRISPSRSEPDPPLSGTYPMSVPVKIFFLAWLALITSITWGAHSYIFIVLWKYLPMFSLLRVWGRLSITLVPVLAWLLAIAYSYFEDLGDHLGTDAETFKRALWILCVSWACVLAAQSMFIISARPTESLDLYVKTQTHISGSSNLSLVEITNQLKMGYVQASIISFAILLAALLIFRKRRPSPWQREFLTGVLVLVSAWDLRGVGPWFWSLGRKDTVERQIVDIPRLDEQSFSIPRTAPPATISLRPAFSVGIQSNWYFQRYIQFLERMRTEDPMAGYQLLGVMDGKKLYFSNSIQYPTVRAYLNEAGRFQIPFDILFYNGDHLTVDFVAPSPGYVSFIDNWDPDWHARVDGKPAPMDLLFGTFKSVKVPSGRHRLEFVYGPFFP